MTGWCSGYSAEVTSSALFCQLDREFESHPVHFLILFQNFEKLSSIQISSGPKRPHTLPHRRIV